MLYRQNIDFIRVRSGLLEVATFYVGPTSPPIGHTSAYPGLRPGLVYGRAVGAVKRIYPPSSEYRIGGGESAGDFSLGMSGLGESGG